MSGLPLADPATRETLLDWLDAFAGHVRDVDYAAAAPLFHRDVLAFGTHRDVIPGLDAWIRTQWDNVWPRTSDFRFDLAAAQVLASADGGTAVVVVPWSSTGYALDGAPFDRPGRATLVFQREGAQWLCVHSHMSLNRGVPQESHAERPVKAWPVPLEDT
ncbi:MAG: nuclear transport factor 2 family protein [Acidisphaera sp.]|nr:nuclear transport factor 2 family protein [Acidisphaera sp.]MBV9813797.1 nuclear transport factor 2 family protein [Acetobacteraceae bacterium]